MQKLIARIIQNELNELLKYIENKIRSDKETKGMSHEWIFIYFLFAQNYLQTILFVCKSENSHRILSLFVTPLTRAIFEILFTVIYLFDDLDKKAILFSKTVHREEKRAISEIEKRYSGNPKWNEHITKQKEFLKGLEKAIQEDFDSETFDWEKNKTKFPRLSEIRDSFKTTKPDVYEFLQLLNDIWYRELSDFSHSEPHALLILRPLLLEENTEQAEEFCNDQCWLSFILLLCIASEIEINLNYGQDGKLLHIWKYMKDSNDTAKEIYETRYQKLLNE